MKNLCLVTGFNKSYHDIADITIPNFVEYCNIHGLDLHVSTKNLNPDIHWGWNKYQIIHDIIDNYDWIVWIDIDCLFIKKLIDIRELIDDNYSLIIGENRNPPGWYIDDDYHIENGVFLLKNDDIGKQMIRTFKDDINENFIKHPWHDQYKMIFDIKNNINFFKRTKRISLKEINATEQFNFKKEEVFIYHCAGGENYNVNQRIELLNKKLS